MWQDIACIFEAVPAKGRLLVWAEPLEWNEPKEKPIVELSISFKSFLDGKPAKSDLVANTLPDKACKPISERCFVCYLTVIPQGQ